MKKKLIICSMILLTLLLSGCGDNDLTFIYFESYNQLENPVGEYQSGGEYTFEANNKRYEVMDGYTASELQIIGKDEDNIYKLIMTDSERNIIFSMITEKECETLYRVGETIENTYKLEAVRGCTDTDGKMYILYSKYDTIKASMHIKKLKSTHILEMDMENYKVAKKYSFGESIVVLTVHDGYVYTIEDGRIYRELLGQTENKECMADLGFRGTLKVKKIKYLTFSIKMDGIEVVASVPDDESEYGYRDIVLSDMKYTDQPIESE